MKVCVSWVRGQVQLLPVRQVIKAWWALSDVMKCGQEGRSVPVAPVKHLVKCPSSEIQLVLNPLGWEHVWRCVPLWFRR